MTEIKHRRGDAHPDGSGRLFWAMKSKKRVDGSSHAWELWATPEVFAYRAKLGAARSLRWRTKHPEKVAAIKRARYQGIKREANLAAARIHNRRQYQKFKDKRLAENKAWRQANRARVADWKRDYKKKRRLADPVFKIKELVGRRLRLFLDNNSFIKERTTMRAIGCSWQQLRAHLESQFKPGMSWNNKHLWHIDHRVPLKTATTAERVYELFHYTNLQPLWWWENLSKGASSLSKISA